RSVRENVASCRRPGAPEKASRAARLAFREFAARRRLSAVISATIQFAKSLTARRDRSPDRYATKYAPALTRRVLKGMTSLDATGDSQISGSTPSMTPRPPIAASAGGG